MKLVSKELQAIFWLFWSALAVTKTDCSLIPHHSAAAAGISPLSVTAAAAPPLLPAATPSFPALFTSFLQTPSVVAPVPAVPVTAAAAPLALKYAKIVPPNVPPHAFSINILTRALNPLPVAAYPTYHLTSAHATPPATPLIAPSNLLPVHHPPTVVAGHGHIIPSHTLLPPF